MDKSRSSTAALLATKFTRPMIRPHVAVSGQISDRVILGREVGEEQECGRVGLDLVLQILSVRRRVVTKFALFDLLDLGPSRVSTPQTAQASTLSPLPLQLCLHGRSYCLRRN